MIEIVGTTLIKKEHPLNASLASLLDKSSLRQLAGQRSYARGCAYFKDGTVVELECEGDSITATVEGNDDYSVKLWKEGKRLRYSCDCPFGMEGPFCKHCVATALTWLAQNESGEVGVEQAAGGTDIRAYLAKQEKQVLVDMLLDLAAKDKLLQQRLKILASKKDAETSVVASFRKTIDAAIVRRGFVDYSGMRSYTRGIKAVADSLQTVLRYGHAAEIRELAEHALKALDKAMHNVDNPDDFLDDVVSQFEDLHHSVCVIAPPDPAALAKFLFDWEMESHWNIFYGAIDTYADVLGEAGIAAYRALAESEWEKFPAIGPVEVAADKSGRRVRIQNLMARVAESTGDIDALIAVRKKDLSSARAYLGIAEIYQKAERLGEAVQWAESGLAQFPDRAEELTDFLIAGYHAKGRHEEAIVLAWSRFEAAPSLGTYQTLKESADYLVLWKDWRTWALDFLRENVTGRNQEKRRDLAWRYREGHSILVDIFLWEEKFDDAWSEAVKGGCSNDLWLKLARQRSETHPADAVDVYLRQMESTLKVAKEPAYREAVMLLGEVQRLKTQLGRPGEFTAVLMNVRHEHRLKRGLIRLLLEKGW